MVETRKQLEAEGVEFRIHSEPTEILPSIWITGPIERIHAEKNYGDYVDVKIDGEWVEDYVPDSQGLTIVTPEGPIVLLGCGHSGSVNLLEQVQRDIQDHSIHALMGGMHLFSATEETLDWTADKLVDIGVQNLMAGHCTGVEPMFRLREGLSLTRKTAVIGAVGSRFVLGEGIHPTAIAQ
jgi:7,8-dihydropterin-6-yl-methyl-4-(beta-D-ribofuranosyl)aminobenzene 5'-phosphate synthase